MSTKTIFLTLVLFLGFSFQNCSKCDCCFDESLDFFDIEGMIVTHFDSSQNQLASNMIPFSEYGFLNISFLVDYVAYQQAPKLNFTFMNAVYGCSPPVPGALGSKEEAFEDFQVITLNDFDDDHSAGSSINDLLFIINLDQEPLSLDEFLDNLEGKVGQESYTLMLSQRPSLSQDFQVSVKVDLSTGENFEVLADLVSFQ